MKDMLTAFVFVLFLSCHLHSQDEQGFGEILVEKSSAVGRYLVRIDVENTDLPNGQFHKAQFYLFEDVSNRIKKLYVLDKPHLNITYKKGKKLFGVNSDLALEKFPNDWLIETDFFEAVAYSPAKIALSSCKTGSLLTTLSQATILSKTLANGETILNVQINPRTRAQYVFSEEDQKLPVRGSMRVAWSQSENKSIESDDEKDYIVNLFDNQAKWKKHQNVYVPYRLELEYTFGGKTAIPQMLVKIDLSWRVNEQIEKFSNEDFLSSDFVELLPSLFD